MVLLCVSIRVPLQYETVLSLSYNGNLLYLSVRMSREELVINSCHLRLLEQWSDLRLHDGLNM
jgi:hypothetical protein